MVYFNINLNVIEKDLLILIVSVLTWNNRLLNEKNLLTTSYFRHSLHSWSMVANVPYVFECLFHVPDMPRTGLNPKV